MFTVWNRLRDLLETWAQALGGQLDPQRLADQTPRVYLGVLNGFAFIGYAFVFSIPLLSLLAGGYWISGTLRSGTSLYDFELIASSTLFLGLGWTSIEILLLQARPVNGVRLSAKDYPHLFGMIKRRVAKFNAPAIDAVRLTEDCDVRVLRTPRNGFLVSQHNTLCIGAPLLYLLNSEQFRVALRCSIGEFSGHKDPNLAELVNLRNSWQQYERVLQGRRSPGAWLLRAFVAWYNPLFQSLSAEAARRHALSRDLYATEVVKDIDVLTMIAAEQVGQQFLEKRFWPTLLKAAERYPKPNARPFSDFEALIRRTLVKREAERWIIQLLTITEFPNADQPTLNQRIAALGYDQLHFISLPEDPAVHSVLGAACEPALKRLDKQWRSHISRQWQRLHKEEQREKQRFERLHERFHEHRLEGDAAIKYARMAHKYLEPEAAIEALQGLIERNPDDAEVLFQLGRLLLENGKQDGLRAVERSIALDKAYAARATPLISEFNLRRKRARALTDTDATTAAERAEFYIA